jgi:glutathione-specific gamma-glutamylcyclotransferase
VLTRDAIKNGFLQRLIASSSASRVWTEGELHASLRGTLAGHHGQDVWLFAYGSLIWNPAFVYVEKCIARVHGFHRRFCLRTKIGRGSPSHPGYVLGLDRGGSCRGVVFRIAEQNVASELEVVWRREMVTGAYVPTWVRAHLAGRTMKAPGEWLGYPSVLSKHSGLPASDPAPSSPSAAFPQKSPQRFPALAGLAVATG